MKISPFLLSISLVVPACAIAAPGAKSVAPPANTPAEGHGPNDGHDHSGPKINEGSLTDYMWRKSDEAFHAGDYPRAIELHRAIVVADPSDVESFGVGAWLMWSMEDKPNADAFIAQGLKANPDSSEMWSTAGAHYSLTKSFAEESNAYGKAVELAGTGADQMLRRRYAHASEHAGDLNRSASIWRELAAEFPTEAVNKNNLARVEKMVTEQNAKIAVKTTGALGLGALALIGVPLWKKRAQSVN